MRAMTPFRSNLFSCLVLLPFANALGHLAPSNRKQYGTCYEKSRDVLKERPSRAMASLWAIALLMLIAWSSFECGSATAIRIVWYLGLGVLWAVHLMPWYTPKRALVRIKQREALGPLKSAFSGVMAGVMDAEPAAYRACLSGQGNCKNGRQRVHALAYSMMYCFLREAIFDARDID
ncbi:hypothetical protein CC80DRAFT_506667 [Byssothecium circinans]|uniref:Uncharacterized protein n=1 Tax=Byssothecium circinans TaxID=147558 RepID=A0A6A5TQL5_9PLEO|nr:hypothetical protein CC80DRAFT_506667 [Byssothecium circinans]